MLFRQNQFCKSVCIEIKSVCIEKDSGGKNHVPQPNPAKKVNICRIVAKSGYKNNIEY